MKPEDEILLTDYLEGDLEASKVEYVEKLLKEDAEAQKIMNQLKKVEIQIDSVLNSDAFNELDRKVSSFLESKFSENKLFDSLIFDSLICVCLTSGEDILKVPKLQLLKLIVGNHLSPSRPNLQSCILTS